MLVDRIKELKHMRSFSSTQQRIRNISQCDIQLEHGMDNPPLIFLSVPLWDVPRGRADGAPPGGFQEVPRMEPGSPWTEGTHWPKPRQRGTQFTGSPKLTPVQSGPADEPDS